MRSKRRCVLEKKQPYSGDEWCSGPDTEEDEDKPHTTAHRECEYLNTVVKHTVICFCLNMEIVLLWPQQSTPPPPARSIQHVCFIFSEVQLINYLLLLEFLHTQNTKK